ncbi:MAG: formate dehydrogenase accessory sulfurtransferase FdhD [Bacteroidia bacterium]|nr:formate dehydrogenase accessory sulfurtransferase FdhD [Bacteroidia bacterium]
MAKPSVSNVRVKKYSGKSQEENDDLLAVEEPLEIRLTFGSKGDRTQKSISVTMRTPGNDFELALGFLFTEGIIRGREDVLQIRYCEKEEAKDNFENIVSVSLQENVEPSILKLERHFYTSSSCGVCGKASIEAVDTIADRSSSQKNSAFRISSSEINALPKVVREQQIVFGHTGGLHASALFNTAGEIVFLREDIGRHNAVDKVIGAAFQKGILPADSSLLFLSGRSSFELIQKAVMAGIPCVAAVGAPSSLAVALAKEFNVTLIGFLRDDRFNVYSGEDRIT